ncbi:MAG: ribosome-associated translation inhibitor RaiA [Gammaproteobacteria bacterium]|nr:ribosome-associated translation inhibitor RaiA [Pseudomonadota bacterium]MCH9662233.1 ribosome-associated translation inhibitor RaiA [Gammaproteobacteria bacterium]
MNINFAKSSFEITPSMQHHAEEKLGRLGRHLDSISHVDVTIKKQGADFMVEALVHNEKARFPQVHAQASAGEYHTAVDLLEAKLIRQIDTLQAKRLQSRRQADDS